MNDQPNPMMDLITDNIKSAFLHLYPTLTNGGADIIVQFNDDETIDVMIPDVTTLRAEIDSDDDGYLRFGLYDPDYEAEHPDEDRLEAVMIRVKAF